MNKNTQQKENLLPSPELLEKYESIYKGISKDLIELIKVEQDQKAAASVRLGSIDANITQVKNGINSISETSGIITQFENTIGAAVGDYGKAIGTWDSRLTPLVEGVGSITLQATYVVELDEAIKKDINLLGGNSETSDDENQEKVLNNSNGNIDLETPKVKLQNVKPKMGV